ncbi:MAG: dehydrogenase [Bacteroidetes bacterium]|nr:MAG: dehydrogenase [Bacteroidota bacterium]
MPASPQPSLTYPRGDRSADWHTGLYRDLLLPRLIEEKMLILLRQGRISKWFSGMGQEAIAVGVTRALTPADWILPLHRNLGVFTTRQMPLERLIGQWLGKATGYTQGRDRSFHFGSLEDRVIGMISHLGAMLPVADGLALAARLDGKPDIAVAFSGDGGTSEGDFHEALNVASVWDLPVLFVVENNGYGLSTPTQEQFRCAQLADRARGYGMEGYTIDGNNVLEVYDTVQRLAAQMREDGRPVLLECMTFRMRGHEEASGTKYVPQALFDTWGQKDPVTNYEAWLEAEGILDAAAIEAIRKELKNKINQAVETAFAAPDITPEVSREVASVYAPIAPRRSAAPAPGSRELRFVDAISEGLRQGMEAHPDLVLMGQDIAEYGGVFKITQGFVEAFGKGRVRNTPICESAILGAGLGLSLAGRKAMVEMQFADFVSCGFNQIVNNLAKNHYRWGHAADVLVRMPTGGGMGAGPYHSQSNESWFAHVPGLKVVYPATPYDAKGLLASALADPNPVLFFEHKGLYRSVSGAVPEAYYHLPLGQARVVQAGEDLTLVTYGLGVHWAQAVLPEIDGSVELIDLRTLLPWDQETVFASVRKTGKCLVLYEDTQTGAFGAEIAASVAEHCFEALDGPVGRLGSLDTPVPFHPKLEAIFQAKSRLKDTLQALLAY